jgi:prophage regulatory protein
MATPAKKKSSASPGGSSREDQLQSRLAQTVDEQKALIREITDLLCEAGRGILCREDVEAIGAMNKANAIMRSALNEHRAATSVRLSARRSGMETIPDGRPTLARNEVEERHRPNLNLPVELMGSRLLRLPEVEARVGLKKPTIYSHIKANRFPVQVKIGSASAWKESDINAYVADPQGWVATPSLP